MQTAVLFSRDTFRLSPIDRHWHEYTAAAVQTWDDTDLVTLAGFIADELERRGTLGGERL